MIYFVRFLSSAAWSCFYPFMAIWLNSAVGLSTSAAGIVVGFAIVVSPEPGKRRLPAKSLKPAF